MGEGNLFRKVWMLLFLSILAASVTDCQHQQVEETIPKIREEDPKKKKKPEVQTKTVIEYPQTQTIPQTQTQQTQPEKKLEEIIVKESPLPGILAEPVKNSKPRFGVIVEDATKYILGPEVATFFHNDITYHILSFEDFSRMQFSKHESKHAKSIFRNPYDTSILRDDFEKLDKLLTPVVRYYMFEHNIKKEKDFTPPEVIDLVSMILSAFTDYHHEYMERENIRDMEKYREVTKKQLEADFASVEEILEKRMKILCRNSCLAVIKLVDYFKNRFKSPFLNNNLRVYKQSGDNHVWNVVFYNIPGDSPRIGMLVVDPTTNENNSYLLGKPETPFFVAEALIGRSRGNLKDDYEKVKYWAKPETCKGGTTWDSTTQRNFFKLFQESLEDWSFRLMSYTHFDRTTGYDLDFVKEAQLTKDKKLEPENALKIWDALIKRKNIFVSKLISDEYTLKHIKENPEFAKKVRNDIMPALEEVFCFYSNEFDQLRRNHGLLDVRNAFMKHLNKIYSSLEDEEKVKQLTKNSLKNLDELVLGIPVFDEMEKFEWDVRKIASKHRKKINQELDDLLEKETSIEEWGIYTVYDIGKELKFYKEADEMIKKNPNIKRKIEKRYSELIEECKNDVKEYYDSTLVNFKSKENIHPQFKELIRNVGLFVESKAKILEIPRTFYNFLFMKERVGLSSEGLNPSELSEIAKEVKSDEVKQILFDNIFAKKLSYEETVKLTGYTPKNEYKTIFEVFENKKEKLKDIDKKDLLNRIVYSELLVGDFKFINWYWFYGLRKPDYVAYPRDLINHVKSGKITGKESAISEIKNRKEPLRMMTALFDFYAVSPIERIKNDRDKLKELFKEFYNLDPNTEPKKQAESVDKNSLQKTNLPLTQDRYELLREVVHPK